MSANSSSFGLGAIITQKQPDASWRPVALTFGCEQFSDYLIGKQFHVKTDLGSKKLDKLPIRIKRFRM